MFPDGRVISCLIDLINLNHTVTAVRKRRHGWNEHMLDLKTGTRGITGR